MIEVTVQPTGDWAEAHDWLSARQAARWLRREAVQQGCRPTVSYHVHGVLTPEHLLEETVARSESQRLASASDVPGLTPGRSEEPSGSMTERSMTMSTTAEATKPANSRVVAKGVRNTLPGATIVKSKSSAQVHLLPEGSTVTLCGTDTAKWKAHDENPGRTFNCRWCVDALKDAKKAAKAGNDDGDAA